MKRIVSIASSFALIGSVAALSACASSSDIDELRNEIASVRTIAEGADSKSTEALSTANQASEDAAGAQAEAQTASEKADRIFRESLRK